MLTTSEERNTIRRLLGQPLKATTEEFILHLLQDAETAEAELAKEREARNESDRLGQLCRDQLEAVSKDGMKRMTVCAVEDCGETRQFRLCGIWICPKHMRQIEIHGRYPEEPTHERTAIQTSAKENPNAKPDPEPADAGPHGLAGAEPA